MLTYFYKALKKCIDISKVIELFMVASFQQPEKMPAWTFVGAKKSGFNGMGQYLNETICLLKEVILSLSRACQELSVFFFSFHGVHS